jgi:hypothetical protein
MIKEKKTTTTRKKKTITPAISNTLKLRAINLHSYDLREINRVILVKKDGTQVNAKFNNVVINGSDDAIENETLYIELKEEKPYYNKYQLHLNSSDSVTSDFSLMYLWSEDKAEHPNYLYEF